MHSKPAGTFGVPAGQGSGPPRLTPSCTTRWWRRHRSSKLSREVTPPSTQCTRWCASHQPGGRSHPGATHPPSRTTSARHNAGATTRVVRPTSSGADAPSVMTRATPASHAMRRNVSAGRRPTSAPSARTRRTIAGPARRSSTSRSTSTVRCGRRARPGPLERPGAAASHSVTNASARRCAVVRVSVSRPWWIHRGAQRSHEDLARLAIQDPIDRNHAV